MPSIGPMVDPECTLLSRVGDGRDSQGTSKMRHNVGEGRRERQLCSTAVRRQRVHLPGDRQHRR
ncbi:hypothetical protein DD630_11800 [Streptomyces sp. BSE7F]|nr:hypothetical protein SAM9427_13670 [Streptomyces sp. ETH9427]PWE07582.1 hypothetical protein DD630_11800 [Streptomyces sp. BSE7F]